MNIIPIAFAFDRSLIMPANVCFTSLLTNANEDTFYEIFILSSSADGVSSSDFCGIEKAYENCHIQYIDVGNAFADAFQIRGITTPTYYRLLIPQLLPQYDKVIYADVDIIFRQDLWSTYSVDLSDNYVAGTLCTGMNFTSDGVDYLNISKIQPIGKYIQAGVLVFNTELIRKDGIDKQLVVEVKNNYKFQDQDIVNKVCGEKMVVLDPAINMTTYSFEQINNDESTFVRFWSKDQIESAKENSNIHYNGQKPWKALVPFFDIWWEYYRKSPVYDYLSYYAFYESNKDPLDKLSLWKRIKVLIRFFTVGKKQRND